MTGVTLHSSSSVACRVAKVWRSWVRCRGWRQVVGVLWTLVQNESSRSGPKCFWSKMPSQNVPKCLLKILKCRVATGGARNGAGGGPHAQNDPPQLPPGQCNTKQLCFCLCKLLFIFKPLLIENDFERVVLIGHEALEVPTYSIRGVHIPRGIEIPQGPRRVRFLV